MEMNIDVYTLIYKEIRKYLKDNLDYEVVVTKLSKQEADRFPLVVVTEEDNALRSSTLNREETFSRLYYEINIFTRDKVIDGATRYAIDLAREISVNIDKVLNKKYHMNRTACRPTPNLDNSIYRITMRYTVDFNDNRLMLM